jgi:glycosyltransferase involved in cell wall biosynthesis
MESKKVLIIANHRKDRSPGQRFRYEQYIPFLELNGYQFTYSNIISKKDDQILSSSGHYFKKALIQLITWLIRYKNAKVANDFSIILIYREALLTRSTYFERQFSKSSAKVIFDYDDAIWLPNVSAGNQKLQVLKSPDKIKDILPLVDVVFAGNKYLADFGKRFNDNVFVIPTTIDTNYHIPCPNNNKESICIGWTGTQTTLKYLISLEDVLVKLKNKYKEQISFKVICDTPWETENLDIKFEKWSREKEIEQLTEINIGIMPLFDDEWSEGKCGFKGLQYMALECASILSPVGVNTDIIEHGVDGFLASSAEEWFELLSKLIENKELRDRLGKNARKTIEKRFSVNAHKESYLKIFNELSN